MNRPPVLKISDEVASSNDGLRRDACACRDVRDRDATFAGDSGDALGSVVGVGAASPPVSQADAGGRRVHEPLPYGRVSTSRKWPLGSSK